MADDVKDKVIRIIAEQAMLDPSDISMTQSLDDLGIDSLGLVESIFAIEEEFDIQVPFNANAPEASDFDISSVAAGFRVTVTQGTITDARLAFGGMAATPRRASAAEAALTGQPWHEDSFEAAAKALAQDFTPLTDWRASAAYRALSAANLLRRFWHEQSGDTAVRLEVA